MKTVFLEKCLRPLLFFLGGGAVGLLYYDSIGCAVGSCLITASPWRTALYMGVLGLLVSVIFEKGCDKKCNT